MGRALGASFDNGPTLSFTSLANAISPLFFGAFLDQISISEEITGEDSSVIPAAEMVFLV